MVGGDRRKGLLMMEGGDGKKGLLMMEGGEGREGRGGKVMKGRTCMVMWQTPQFTDSILVLTGEEDYSLNYY